MVGRKAASLPGFEYSGPLKASGITWTEDKLSQWVSGPAKMVPGTKMAFPGITSKADIRNVVAYLGHPEVTICARIPHACGNAQKPIFRGVR